MPTNLQLLHQVPLFRNMSESEIRQLAEVAAEVQFPAGEFVTQQGKTGQSLWILLEGNCEVIKVPEGQVTEVKSVRLALLEPLSNFGEMSFFHPAPHSASVRALTAVRLLRINRDDYEELVNEGCCAAYRLACNALHSVAERLRRMDEWVAELVRNGQHPATENDRVPEWNHFRDRLFTGWNL